MKASRGEIKIYEILTMNDVRFVEEFSFEDLRSMTGTKLRFDFAVFDEDGGLDFLIEFQGEQHYRAKDKFGGAAGLYKQQYNDMKKREYCKKHNIPLVIIPYWDEDKVNYTYIFKAAGY